MDEVDAILSELDFFAGMDAAHLDLIGDCGAEITAEPGDYLLREGEHADTFYVIRSGSIALEAYMPGRGAITIQTLAKEDLLGWSWLFPPYKWHFDARALERSTLYAFSASCLRQKCDDDPAFGYAMMRRVAQAIVGRLQATRLQLMDIDDYAIR